MSSNQKRLSLQMTVFFYANDSVADLLTKIRSWPGALKIIFFPQTIEREHSITKITCRS
jgi:hypothetical protein